MKFRDSLICFICFLLIPFGISIWIENKANANIYSKEINDMTLIEYVSTNVTGEYLNNIITSIVETQESMIVDSTPEDNHVSISINFAGDCTIGSDSNFGYANTFYDVYNKEQDYSYFFANMKDLFLDDDLTVVNLEGTLTDYNVKNPKEFNFKGPPHYANILLSGDINAVNLANNHTKDYGQKGFEDTIQTLEEYNIPYFGYDNYYIYEKDGIKIGFAGLTSIWDGTINKRIDDAIAFLDENGCDAKIFTFHWGIEREYKQNANQQRVGRYAIDKGADLVVGHHPHVIQGIEEYNGKYIVYSLSNFCFGGNTNPPDKDTMVFNLKLDFEDNELVDSLATIYPAKVSSVNNRNDYKPTLAEGEEYNRIMNKILRYSNIGVNESGEILRIK